MGRYRVYSGKQCSPEPGSATLSPSYQSPHLQAASSSSHGEQSPQGLRSTASC